MTHTLMNEGWAGLRPQHESYVSGGPLKQSYLGTSRGIRQRARHGNQQQARYRGPGAECCAC